MEHLNGTLIQRHAAGTEYYLSPPFFVPRPAAIRLINFKIWINDVQGAAPLKSEQGVSCEAGRQEQMYGLGGRDS